MTQYLGSVHKPSDPVSTSLEPLPSFMQHNVAFPCSRIFQHFDFHHFFLILLVLRVSPIFPDSSIIFQFFDVHKFFLISLVALQFSSIHPDYSRRFQFFVFINFFQFFYNFPALRFSSIFPDSRIFQFLDSINFS